MEEEEEIEVAKAIEAFQCLRLDVREIDDDIGFAMTLSEIPVDSGLITRPVPSRGKAYCIAKYAFRSDN